MCICACARVLVCSDARCALCLSHVSRSRPSDATEDEKAEASRRSSDRDYVEPSKTRTVDAHSTSYITLSACSRTCTSMSESPCSRSFEEGRVGVRLQMGWIYPRPGVLATSEDAMPTNAKGPRTVDPAFVKYLVDTT